MKKKRTLSYILLVSFFLLAAGGSARAEALSPSEKESKSEAFSSANGEVDPDIRTLKETYTSADPDEKYDFPQTRIFEDWEGELKSVTYEIIKIDRPEDVPVLREMVEFSWSEQIPEPESTIIRNGVTYYLTEVDMIESPKTGRTVILDERVRYYGYMDAPDAADRFRAVYTDPATGEEAEAYLPLKELKKEKHSWREDVTFELYAENPSASCYELAGKPFDMGQLPEKEDYPAILELLSLDPERYRIETMTWADHVTEESTDTVIIQGTCSRFAADYVACYEAEVPLPDLPGYIGTAVYEAKAEKDYSTEDILYTIQASAIYERQVDFPIEETAITAAGTIIIILFLHRRHKRRKNDT